MTAFELAVQDAHGAAVAQRVGADRMELATALSTGGLTPSAALIERAVATGVEVHVLVRPREGGFDYDAAERELIVADVGRAVGFGAAGVVIGGLRAGAVDADLVRDALVAAGGREVTFHRAFDQLADPCSALEQLVGLGVTRVLTSGAAPSAADALAALRGLVERAAGRIQIMAGAGVTSANAAEIAATGVDAVHASAKRTVTERLAVSLGAAAAAGTVSYATTDEREAAALRGILKPG
ncbi:copper homeostasis protein CutC [Microbacterium halophytorum]|uniref:copper homeostasis protein CutC n=1 Tax=Microbacterium halophytorum TaxID=2067568 RepID=UPI000CFD72F9|nr:copper homeostasis protein CutC [Microbacterium halophytorum]